MTTEQNAKPILITAVPGWVRAELRAEARRRDIPVTALVRAELRRAVYRYQRAAQRRQPEPQEPQEESQP